MAENIDSKNTYMKSIYYDPKNPASFSGLNKFTLYVKKHSRIPITRNDVKIWLSKQNVYTSHAPVIRRFKRAKVISGYPRYQYSADTAYMLAFADENEQYKYFVVVIDVFTRFLFTFAIKKINANEVLKGLKNINGHSPPDNYHFDSGSEYKNQLIKNYLTKLSINVFYSTNEIKAAHAERAISTVKTRLTKYMKYNKTNKWIDVLDQVTDAYNNSIHSKLGMTPVQALSTPKHILWEKEHGEKPIKIKKELKNPKSRNIFKFKIGNKVKLSYLRGVFDRQYSEKWTSEIFEITDRLIYHNLPVYRIKDYNNSIIFGIFYQNELKKVIQDDNPVYEIEKILKKKIRKKVRFLLVKWKGWSSKFNSWVPETEIKDYKTD